MQRVRVVVKQICVGRTRVVLIEPATKSLQVLIALVMDYRRRSGERSVYCLYKTGGTS